MKILHIVEDFSISSGGLRTVINDLNNNLINESHKSSIISSNKESKDHIHLINTANSWLYSKEWLKIMQNLYNQNQFDVVHIHGVWLYPQYIAAKFCVKNKIPFLLSVHGMYEPWLWTKGRFKKKMYFKFVTKKYFQKAALIHCITSNEKENLKKLFGDLKFVEIPNLINVNEEGMIPKVHKPEKYLLYLGRLDEKKGIDILIKAFSLFKEDFKLFITGPFNDYKMELEGLIKSLGLQGKIEFKGLVKGEKKNELIKKAWVLISPSHSEVIGMVNLEAASLKTPVITTYQTGINPEFNNNGGILINPEVKELVSALSKVASWSIEERNTNGQKLYEYISKEYSWSNRMKDWINTYKKVLGNE
tara:strand:- start:524 stop:1609 length:1086 start_codon:yes stop_codon:yes gene_type:complete